MPGHIRSPFVAGMAVIVGVGTGMVTNPETLDATKTISVDCAVADIFIERPEDSFIGDLVCDATMEMLPLFDGDEPTIYIHDTSERDFEGSLAANYYDVDIDVVNLSNYWFPRKSIIANQQIAIHELAHRALLELIPPENRDEYTLGRADLAVSLDAGLALDYLVVSHRSIFNHDGAIGGMQNVPPAVELQGTVWEVFTESTYLGGDYQDAGHPWSDPGELFASIVSISLTHPAAMLDRISELTPERQAMAADALRAVKNILSINGKPAMAENLIPEPA